MEEKKKKKKKVYGENVFESDEDYFFGSNDELHWKVLYMMYKNQGKKDKIVIDFEEYRQAKLDLLHMGAVKQWQNTRMSFAEFLSRLKHPHEVINLIPDNPIHLIRWVKAVESDNYIINEIEKRIDPVEKFKRQNIERVGRPIVEAIEKKVKNGI